MRRILPFDELNNLQTRLTEHFTVEESWDGTSGKRRIRSKKDVYDIIDMLLDLFLLAYANGVASVNERFNTDIVPTPEELKATIYKKIDGATWEDRVWAWYEAGGDEADIMRIAETEAHRDGNTAADTTAKKAGASTKTWRCMMLPTSRDTHIYLNGTTVGINDEFYTFAGNHTMFPGQFGVAEEDCGCLCELEYN